LGILESPVLEELGRKAHMVADKHVFGWRLVESKEEWAEVIILGRKSVRHLVTLSPEKETRLHASGTTIVSESSQRITS